MEIYSRFPAEAIDRAKQISQIQNIIINFTDDKLYMIQTIVDDDKQLADYCLSIVNNLFWAFQLRSKSIIQLFKLFSYLLLKDSVFLKKNLICFISHHFIRCHSNYEKHAKFIFQFMSGIFQILDPQFDCNSTNEEYIHKFCLKLLALNQIEFSRIEHELTFPHDDLLSIIYRDDVDRFQMISANQNIDYNSTISIENPFLFNITKDMVLIEVALALGSIKIFKFLLLNKTNLNQNRPLSKYSIQGGNLEMIHIIEQHGFTFSKDEIFESSYFHRNALIEWIIGHGETDVKTAIQAAALSNNFAFYLSCLEENQFYRHLSQCDNLIELTALSGNYDFFNLLRTNDYYQLNQTIFSVVEYGVLQSAQILASEFHSCINATNKLRQKPIHIVAQKGDTFMYKFLIENYPEIDLNATDRYGATPLHLAIRFGHPEFVELLLASEKVDVNLIDLGGSSPLHESLSSPNRIFTQLLLLSPKTNINIADQSGNTPLVQALLEKKPDVVQLILDSKKEIDDLQSVISQAIPINAEITKQLMNIANLGDKVIVETIINRILECKNYEYIQYFIDQPNFDINLQFTENMNTILHLCCSIKDLYHFISKLLTRKDIDVNIANINGATPLHLAMSSQNNDYSIALIQDNRVQVNAKDKGDQTPLHYAASNWSSVPLIDLLLKPDLNPNAIDKDGKTPLFIACELGLADNVEILLNDFQVETEIEIESILFFFLVDKWNSMNYFFNYTAIQMAGRKGHVEVVNVYRKYQEKLLKSKEEQQKSKCFIA